MDPFTVTTACIGTIAGIAQLTSQIANFISQLKDAQEDMQAVSTQLEVVAKSLEELRDESMKVNYPKGLQQRLIDMVRDCDTVVTSMQRVLDEVSNAKTSRRLQWTLTGKNDMKKLSSRLEAHKTAIVVAVSVASLCLNTEIKSNTDQILRETAALHQQMALMQLQMTSLRQSDSTGNVAMQRFMEETTSYAESVLEDQQISAEALQTVAQASDQVINVPSMQASDWDFEDPAGPSIGQPGPLKKSGLEHVDSQLPLLVRGHVLQVAIGVLCSALYNPAIHEAADTYEDAEDGQIYARDQIMWVNEKGSALPLQLDATFYHRVSKTYKPGHQKIDKLYASFAPKSLLPSSVRQANSSRNAFRLCGVFWDFSNILAQPTIKTSFFSRRSRVHQIRYKIVVYLGLSSQWLQFQCVTEEPSQTLEATGVQWSYRRPSRF